MNENWIIRGIDEALPLLMNHVLTHGDTFQSRAGATRDVTYVGVTLSHPEERYITHPDRKHNLAAQIAETMWVLSGRDDVEWLERYLPRARDFSDDGKVWRGAYGKRLRRWPRRDGSGDVIDQVAYVVDLLRADHNTRRAVISIYDPEVDNVVGKDIPCNDFLTFSIRNGLLDVGVTIRSNDLMWGWSGINAFEWSVLQEIVADCVGVGVGALHFSITSLHLYEQHWERAEKIAARQALPRFTNRIPFNPLEEHTLDHVDKLIDAWFRIEEQVRRDPTSAQITALVNSFPEPMMRSWLTVLQWWWSTDERYLDRIQHTDVKFSALASIRPKPVDRRMMNGEATHEDLATECDVDPDCGRHVSFVDYVTNLHTEKHNAYGDSWKRRGEMLGIMANIARKIDRLPGAETADETSADTAIDLLVYLAKYRWWLVQHVEAPSFGVHLTYEDPEAANAIIRKIGETDWVFSGRDNSIEWLTEKFSLLEREVSNQNLNRYIIVDEMLPCAFILAKQLWTRTTNLFTADPSITADSARNP